MKDLRNTALDKLKSHHCRRVGLPLTFPSDLILNGLTDGQFTGSLTDLSQVSTRKAIGHLGQEVQVHVLHKKEYIVIPNNKITLINYNKTPPKQPPPPTTKNTSAHTFEIGDFLRLALRMEMRDFSSGSGM